MSTAEKLRSKHIRTLEALAELVRENEALQHKVAELQHAIDLRNATDQTDESSNSKSQEQLQEQLEKVEFDNQQLAKQTEASVAAIAQLKQQHEVAIQKMIKEKYALAREAGEAKTELETLQSENEGMREEFVDLRGKAKKAWEFEVSNRSHVLEIEKLREEIERLKVEEKTQRDAYVQNLKQTEEEASLSIQQEKDNGKHQLEQAMHDKDTQWQKIVGELTRELQLERERSLQLEDVLTKSAQRCSMLESKVHSSITSSSPPQAPTSPKNSNMHNGGIDMRGLEEKILQLESNVKEGHATIELLKRQLAEKEKLLRAATEKDNVDSKDDKEQKGFGAFIDMKRENQVLRAQIKDLMQTQARILSGSSARRVEPGGSRRRRR